MEDIEKIPVLVRDNENGAYYVKLEVCDRIYRLLKDQKVFYNTHSKKVLESCKQRENAFIEWYEKILGIIANEEKNSFS